MEKLSKEKAKMEIEKFLFSELGLSVKLQEWDNLYEKATSTNTYHDAAEVSINPKMLMGMSPAFETIDLVIRTGMDEFNIWYIELRYSWSHYRGSNGYTTCYDMREVGSEVIPIYQWRRTY